MTQPHRLSPIVVTGATGMLGSATAAALAQRGASTLLVVRNPAKGQRLLHSLPTGGGSRHRMLVGDLSEPASVRDIAEQIRAEKDDVGALIHTAAALFKDRKENSGGHEAMFATNVLARFLLTQELAQQLAAGSGGRVIYATGPSPDRLDFDNLMAEASFNAFRQFRATNAANLQLALQTARRVEGTTVTSNAYHPGALQSDLMAGMPKMVRLITVPFGRSATKAAQALAELAFADRHTATNGKFYKRDKATPPPKATLDSDSRARLWETCAQLLGVAPD